MKLSHALLWLPDGIELDDTATVQPSGDILVTGRISIEPRTCGRPNCCGTLKRNGPRTRQLEHASAGRRLVRLRLETANYRCARDAHTFTFLPPLCLPSDRLSLLRLSELHWLLHRGLPLSTVADIGRVHSSTVRAVLDSYLGLAQGLRRRAPRALGIDELYLNGRVRTVLVSLDPDDRHIIAILPEKTDAAIVKAVADLDDLSRIERLVMDMDGKFHKLGSAGGLRALCPRARIVNDAFHVVQLAAKAIQRYLTRLRSRHYPRSSRALHGLGRVLCMARADWKDGDRDLFNAAAGRHPELVLIRDFYADLRRTFRFATAAGAQEHLDILQARLHGSDHLRAAFGGFFCSLEARRQNILRYFEEGLTAGYTEAKNRDIRSIYDGARGWGRSRESWDRFEGLVLLRHGAWTYPFMQQLWHAHVARTLPDRDTPLLDDIP